MHQHVIISYTDHSPEGLGLADGSWTVAVTKRITTNGDGVAVAVTVTVTVLVLVTVSCSMGMDDVIVTITGSAMEKLK